MKLSQDQFDMLLSEFFNWYNNDHRSKKEYFEKYKDFPKKSFWEESNTSNKQLIELLREFVNEGGKIQSGGYRYAGRFINNIENRISVFREKILEIFNEDFNISNWWDSMTEFKGFGKGIRSIFLFHINPDKYIPFNDKTNDAYKLLGLIDTDILNDSKGYDIILAKSKLLIEFSKNKLNNDQADALTHYIIGTDEGIELIKSLLHTSAPSINYWIFQANPKIYDIINSLKDKALKTWSVRTHKNEIKKGDKVILWVTGENSGCYALCEVASDIINRTDDINEQSYYTSKSTNEPHDRVELSININLWNRPVLKENLIRYSEFENFVGGLQGTNFKATEKQYNLIKNIIGEKMPQSKYSLNTILYGPPGTGKTYQTKSLAIKIIEGLSDEQFRTDYPNRESIIEKYQKYITDGQIEFITFHQSFSYEDFIEGIKPKIKEELEDDTTDKYDGSIEYEVKKGIFKEISERAFTYKVSTPQQDLEFSDKVIDSFNNADFYKISLGNTARREDDAIYEYCIKNNCIALGFFNKVNLSDVKTEKELKEKAEEYSQGSYAYFALKCFKFWIKPGDIVFVSYGNLSVRAIGIVEGDYQFSENIRYNHTRKIKWIMKDVSIPVNEVYEKRFSQQAIYQMYNHLVKKDYFKSKTIVKEDISYNLLINHVFIIDEINRGNIANIFGELITLIEDDKRSGMSEEITTILPYSKEEFTVPPNLYIIGTMNTADRSIEALDTALRRRFSFIEMKPQPEELSKDEYKCEGVGLEKLLSTINSRIEVILDKDHCIGHSYFMTIKDKLNPNDELKEIFSDRIIPLLQEYFYGDISKIGLILGGTFIKKKYDKGTKINFAKSFKAEDNQDYEDKIIYEITKPEEWDFTDIYAQE